MEPKTSAEAMDRIAPIFKDRHIFLTGGKLECNLKKKLVIFFTFQINIQNLITLKKPNFQKFLIPIFLKKMTK